MPFAPAAPTLAGRTGRKIKFAAYYDVSIYGVADTADEAIAKAHRKARNDDAEWRLASLMDV
jgi:hypothetical protein